MKLTNIAAISMVVVLMGGCGGSSGGSSDSSSAPVPVEPQADEAAETNEQAESDVVALDPDAIYDTTAELVVANSFLLKQEYEVNVGYQNDSGRSAYLSVCTRFTTDKDDIEVDYDSCLLRTSIDGDYAGTLTVANNQNSLVMAIWYFDDMENPRYEIWGSDSSAEGTRNFYVN